MGKTAGVGRRLAAVAAAAVAALALAGGGGAVEVAPLVCVADRSVEEGDGPRRAIFRVTLSRPAAADVRVSWRTVGGTATLGADVRDAAGTTTIRAGTTVGVAVVTVLGDRRPEYADETFRVRVTGVAGGAAVLDDTGVGTIVEDDRALDLLRRTAGGFSWSNAYLLAALSHAAYVPILGAATETAWRERFTRLALAWGASAEPTFPAAADTIGTFDTQAAVVRAPGALLVVFRGTEPTRAQDIATDALVPLLPVGVSALGPVSVHLGFWQAANAVYPTLQAAARAARARGDRVFLTGHSLGGALATVTAWQLEREGIDVQGVYPVASPRVGNLAFALDHDARLGTRSQRLQKDADPVPNVPPGPPLGSYAHVRRLVDLVGNAVVLDRPLERIVVGFDLADHDSSGYALALRARARSEVDGVGDAEFRAWLPPLPGPLAFPLR